ncbi:MAG: CBS domain-containing protein [Thermoanaerobaculia bacterium]
MYNVELPTARDCMTTNVVAFSPDEDLFEAMTKLLNHHFAAAPVVDSEGKLTGMLTEKDCLRILSNFAYDDDLEGGKVSDYESAIRVICEPQMDLFGVTDRFLATNFPLLPVVDDGRLVGVISRRDTLRGIEELRQRIDLERQKFERTAGRQADRPRSIERMQRVAANRTKEQFVRLMGRRDH